jgi:Fic family protein
MRSGKYINQLSGDLQYKAFIPNSLPFEIKSDNELQNLLSKADLSLGRLDGIAETLPDVDFFILMYIRKEATLSSQVEGTQATFADVLKAEAKIKDLEIHKDADEILNYIYKCNELWS